MPLRDYQCHKCGRVQEILERGQHATDKLNEVSGWPTCCGLLMYMLPSTASFKVTGYSFKNGYSGSKGEK